MSENTSYTPPAAPPQTPGFPQNPLPIEFSGFAGLNTKASPQGIGDQEMFICDGLMPLGPNNLRTLYDLGSAIFTAPGITTIKAFGFANLGANPLCIVCLSDGSLVQVNTTTLAQTTIGAAGTVTEFPVVISQWGASYVIIVGPQDNGYWLWDGTNLYTAGTISPEVTVDDGGLGYTGAPTITLRGGGAFATGNFAYSGQPNDGDTVTINGQLCTYTNTPGPGIRFPIGGNLAGTIFLTVQLLPPLANNIPALTGASYVRRADNQHLDITFNTPGTSGNAFTLAATGGIVTPSAGTLTGGVDGGAGATFAATVADGSVVSVAVTNPGTGFKVDDTPLLEVTGGGSDDQAYITATVTPGALGVSSVQVNNGGRSYTSLAGIAVTGSATVPAQLSVVGSNGVITGVVVVNPGLGYTSPPGLSVIDVTGSLGTGASLTAIMSSGQITGTSIVNPGSGYTSPPTLNVIGDGQSALLQAAIGTNGVVGSVAVVNGGFGYTKALVDAVGGNRAAHVSATIMPFGVQGNAVETYVSRVFVGDGRNGQVSAPGSPSDFDSQDGSTAFQSNDSFLKVMYEKFIQSNGFLYLLGDSSINYISGVSTTGNPPVTTFSNLNVDPQIGSPWPGTVQLFGRDIVFANPIGVYVSYGGAVTKVSDALDGIYATVPQANWPAGFQPSAAVMTIFGIQVYILLMPIIDQVSGSQVIKCLMWDGKKWFTSPQSGLSNGFLASQEINSVLTAYCTPEGTTIRPMFNTPSSNLTKYLYSKLWDNPGVFLQKMVREWFATINANTDSLATPASGYIRFSANPTDGDTITLNGQVCTFTNTPGSGIRFPIAGTLAATILLATFQLPPNGNNIPALTVASYALASNHTDLTITYNTTGPAGNAYTLAASAATPSGATLTGGKNAEQIFLAAVTEQGVQTEVNFTLTRLGPQIIGPLAVSDQGVLVGVRMRTTSEDMQLVKIVPFGQIMQTNT